MGTTLVLVILSIVSINGEVESIDSNWGYFVHSVWDECFKYNNLCKSIFSSFYVQRSHEKANTPVKQDTEDLKHFSEQVLFHRTRENINSIYVSKYELFKIYLKNLEQSPNTIKERAQYSTQQQTHVDNIVASKMVWEASILDLLEYEPDISTNTSNNQGSYTVIMNKKAISHISGLISDLYTLLFTKELSLSANVLLHHVGKTQEKQKPNTQSTATNVNSQTFDLVKCSPNKYPVWDPTTNTHACVCYPDKNCILDINSVSEPDSLKPIIIILILVILICLLIRIYQSTSPLY